MTLDSYFNETSPEEYRFLGFYEYRQKQDDFTFSFQKEALRLRRSLDYLLESDCLEDVKRNVEKLKKSFEDHRHHCKDVGIFWDKIEGDLANIAIKTKEKELCLSEVQFCLDQSLAGNEAQVILNQIKLGILSDRKRKSTNDTEKDIELETHKKAKKATRVASKTNTRKSKNASETSTRNNNEKSSEQSSSSDVGPEDDEEISFDFVGIEEGLLRERLNEWKVGAIDVSQRFKQYQIETLEKAKNNGLKWSDFHEMLALSSIIVLSSPCPYPSHIFTI